MLVHFMRSSGIVVAMLVVCFLMVLAFEATNGFHDASGAVATVIYTQSLRQVPAVVWSGLMNFIGLLAGGIAVGKCLGRDPSSRCTDRARRPGDPAGTGFRTRGFALRCAASCCWKGHLFEAPKEGEPPVW
jgi:hypothetical protein